MGTERPYAALFEAIPLDCVVTLCRYAVRVCVPLLLVWLALHLWDKHRLLFTTTPYKLPPGRFGWPLIGETLPFVTNGRAYFQSRIARYGPIFTSHLVGRPIVVVCGAENIKPILTGEHTLVHNHLTAGSQILFGSGALSCTRDPAAHKMKQKAIRKTFTNSFMNHCLPIMQDLFHSHVTSWVQRGYANGVDDVKRLNLLIGAKTLLGFEIGGNDANRLLELFNIYNDNFFSLPFNVPGTGFRKAIRARQELIQIIQESIKKRRGTDRSDNVLDILTGNQTGLYAAGPNEKNNNNNKQTDTKTAPLNWETLGSKDNKVLNECNIDSETDAAVIDMVLEILFASQSTIASACCSLLAHLSLQPRVVESIRQELRFKWFSCGGLPLFENLLDLAYVNDVVKEVLRLSPPVAGGFRQAKETLCIEGYHIPKGWSILYCITDTHEASNTFAKEDRLLFQPERWSRLRKPGANQKPPDVMDRFEYIPFGKGGRKCVGKEFALMFLRLFTVEMCTLCNWKMQNGDVMPQMKTSPLPFPADGLPLFITEAE